MEDEKIKDTEKEIVKKPEEHIHKNITENPDSITIGSATKGAQIKVYGDFDKLEDFKKKIDNATEVQKYATAQLAVNI